MQIIWTRSSLDWQSDKNLFDDNIDKVIHIPCVKIQAIDYKISSNIKINTLEQLTQKSCAVIVNSLNCAKHLTNNKNLNQLFKNFTCISTSCSAAAWLNKYDYKVYKPSEINYACDMSEWIYKNITNKQTLILPGPRKRAYPLEEKLKSKYEFVKLDLYETICKVKTSKYKNISGSKIIAFASPSAIKGFVSSCYYSPNNKLLAVCIGRTTYDYCSKYFTKLILSPTTNMRALAKKAISLDC